MRVYIHIRIIPKPAHSGGKCGILIAFYRLSPSANYRQVRNINVYINNINVGIDIINALLYCYAIEAV